VNVGSLCLVVVNVQENKNANSTMYDTMETKRFFLILGSGNILADKCINYFDYNNPLNQEVMLNVWIRS
jgi:hypothetical protein